MARYDIYGNIKPESDGEAPFTGKTGVFFGDSIPTFDKNTGGIGAIPDYLQQIVGGTWKNFGIGGTTLSAYRLSNSTYDMFTFGELADSVASGDFSNQETGVTNGVNAGSTSYKAAEKVYDMERLDWDAVDTICIHFGTNDLSYAVSQVGSASDASTKNGSLCAALKYGVETIRASYPLIKFIFCGVMFRNADSVSDSSIMQCNAALEETCGLLGIRFVDMRKLMGVDAVNKGSFLYDGTHPNAAGKQRYADVLAKEF